MTRSGRMLPALAPDLEFEEFGDEIVVLVNSERRAVRLEAGPALVVDSCRRRDDRTTLIDELRDATASTCAEATAWLDLTLVELARLGVVAAESRSGWSPPSERPDPRRR